MKTKITFKDHGQDLLGFIIDADNKIESAFPFHSAIYAGAKVMNRKFTIGRTLKIKHEKYGPYEIKYSIIAVETIND